MFTGPVLTTSACDKWWTNWPWNDVPRSSAGGFDGTNKRGRMRPLRIAADALSPARPALLFRGCCWRRGGWRRWGIGVPRVADDEPLPAALLVDGKVLADFDRGTRFGLDGISS